MEDQFLRSRTLIKDVFVAVAARTQFQSMISTGENLYELRITDLCPKNLTISV